MIMKAKVKETGEIIDVKCLYSVIYSRLDCNGKIVEEYDEDELEIIRKEPKVKMVSLDKVCEWLNENLTNNPSGKLCASNYGVVTKKMLIDEFKKTMEE